MTIPEIKILDCIRFFLKYVSDDYKNATDKTQTILADLFTTDDFGDPLVLDKMVILDNAISLIANRDVKNNPNALQPTIGYNLERTGLPTIHILLSARNKGRYDSIGLSRGEFTEEVDLTHQTDIYDKVRTFYCNISLIISSPSVNEALIIFYFLETMFDYFSEHMSFLGFNNFKFSSQDINLDTAILPNAFHRSLILDFDIQKQIKVRELRDMADAFALNVCSNIGTDYPGLG